MVEVTHSSTFHCVQFHRPLPLRRRLGDAAARTLCATSLPILLKPRNSLCSKASSLKHTTWRNPSTYVLPDKRRPAHESPNSFSLVEKLCRTHDELNEDRRCKLSRHIVRSSISATGTAGSAYPLSENQAGSILRGICFYAVTSFVAIVLFPLMVVSHPFVLLFDRYKRKAQHLIAKMWSSFTISPFFKIEFEGLNNLPAQDSPAVYVCNHQSFLDIYTLLTLGRSYKFISKTSIFLYPIIGWAMYLMGTISLKRMDSRSQLDCLKRCIELIKKGASVFFFPEGTRSKTGKLGTFKKGAFSVAAKTGVPVVPITLVGTGKIMPAGMESRINPGGIKVVVHPPILGKNPELMCNEARSVIADVLIREGCEV